MSHEPELLESRNNLEIFQVSSPSIDLALKIVQKLSTYPTTPQNITLITLILAQLQEKQNLAYLEKWLCSEVESFIDQSPRDQPSQAARVLLVACCIYSRELMGKPLGLKKDKIFNYIKYAADHKWFDDPYVAFYCYYVKGVYGTYHNTIDDFFDENYSRYIEHQNIAAVAQSLIVLSDKINEVEKGRCYHVLRENRQSASLTDLAWCLLGLSVSNDAHDKKIAQELAHKLVEYLNEDLAKFAEVLVVLDFLSSLGDDTSQADMDLLTQASQIPVELKKGDGAFSIRLPLPEQFRSIDLFTISLLLFAVIGTGWSNFTGVSSKQSTELISLINEAERLRGKKAISAWELVIANVLAIIATFLLGAGPVIYFLGGNISYPQINCSQCDLQNIDVWVVLVIPWIILLFTQVLALLTGQSAISYWAENKLSKEFSRGVKTLFGGTRN